MFPYSTNIFPIISVQYFSAWKLPPNVHPPSTPRPRSTIHGTLWRATVRTWSWRRKRGGGDRGGGPQTHGGIPWWQGTVHIWLVVYQPLWKMMEFVSWDDDIPNIWKNKIHVPNHQPDYIWWCNGKWKDFHVFTQIYIFLAVPVQELFQDIYFPMARPMPW